MLAPEITRILRNGRRFYVGIVALAGALTALVAVIEKFDESLKSKAALELYAFCDLARFDLPCVLLGIGLAWIGISGIAVAFGAIVRSRKARWQWPSYSRAVSIIAVTLLITGPLCVYQGIYYVKGKMVALRTYPAQLRERASRAFLEEHIGLAEFYLRVGSTVFHSSSSEQLRAELIGRLGDAKQLRAVSTWVRTDPPLQADILQAATYLDRNISESKARVSDLERIWMQERERYAKAVRDVAAGRIALGVAELDAIEKSLPGFADANKLAADCRGAGLNDSSKMKLANATGFPYLSALSRMGADQFIRATLEPWSTQPLDSLSRWVAAGAPLHNPEADSDSLQAESEDNP